MKYQNGNIILSAKENKLLSSLTDMNMYESLEAQHFVFAMHSLVQDISDLLVKFQSDPSFIQHEREVRFNMNIMTTAIDQLRERAVALAREAGEELALE